MNDQYKKLHQISQPKFSFRFCPVCGNPLRTLRLKQNEPHRLVCSKCDFILYLDPKLAVSSIVEMNGGIVLVKRDIGPMKGSWVTPGGYVDRGEEVKEAAIRETVEECGILTRVKDLLGVYSYTGRLVVVITFISEYISGDLIAGDEVQDVKLCRSSEIPWDDMAFQSTTASLEDYYHLKKRHNIPSKVKEPQSAFDRA